MDIRAVCFHGPAIAQGDQGGRAKSWEGATWVKTPIKPAFSGSQTAICSLH